jgi:hypothetical protein
MRRQLVSGEEGPFFFEKKKQKTFLNACGAPHARGPKPREH